MCLFMSIQYILGAKADILKSIDTKLVGFMKAIEIVNMQLKWC